MAVKKAKVSEAVPVAKLVVGQVAKVLLKDFDLSYENQRTGDWTVGDSNDNNALEGNSFKEMVDSIREVGQKEPVTGRIRGKKVQLIKGFRRFAAIRAVARENQALDTATVDVLIKDLDDIQAFEEHVIENTARDNLKGSDLAFAAYKMQQLYASRGLKLSGNQIAQRMGKNQSYISMLLRIVEGAPTVAAKWREAPVQLSISEMTRISKLKEPAQQDSEYKRLLGLKPDPNADGNDEPNDKWVVSAIEKVQRIATQLGAFEAKGLITVTIAWDEKLADLGITLKEGATTGQVNKIANAARQAYAAAKEPPAPKEKPARGKRAAKAAQAAN